MVAGTGMPPHLIKYWVAGPGAAKILWNTHGDYDRCIAAIQAEVTDHGGPPLSDRMIHGLCATLHKMATGGSPGHGSAE
jgi:hypothetical protein